MFEYSVTRSLRTGAITSALALAGCVTSPTMLGTARAPISPAQVQLYLEPVAGKHEDIAILTISSRYSWTWTSEGKAEVIIERLKEQAAKLGANGVELQEITDAGGSLGAGVGTDITRDHASIALGFDGGSLMAPRYGRAIAVYVDIR